MAFFRHTAIGLFNGFTWTTNILSSGAVSEASANTTWVTAFGDLWSNITTLFGSAASVSTLQTATLTAAFKQQTKTTASSALAGTAGTNVNLPYQCVPHITFKLSQQGKGNRGGMNLPPCATSALAAAPGIVLSATAKTDIDTGATAMLAAMATGGLTPVVLTRKTLTTLGITGAECGVVLKTQRRRYSKVGDPLS